MVKISNSCLRALEGGMEQSLLNFLNNRARWDKGASCAILHPCALNVKKRDWQNGTMVGCTAVIRGNRVETLYCYIGQEYDDHKEEFELLSKDYLIRRLNSIIDVEKRRKDWELFTGVRR